MNRYYVSIPAIVLAAAVLGAGFCPAAAQDKEERKKKDKAKQGKAEKTDGIDYEEIIIKRKDDKDGKVTIEIKGGEITVNGKPLEDYDDDDIVVAKEKQASRFTIAFPCPKRRAFI